MGLFEYEFNKRSSSNTVSEDELTSRVFGILEAVGHDILSEWVGIDGVKSIKYWPQFEGEDEGIEPDVIITDSKGNKILVECKFTDLGSVKQVKKEYKLAKNILKGDFVFITANLSRPEVLRDAENALGLHEGTLKWNNWTSLFKIIKKSLSSGKVLKAHHDLLEELMKFLEWLRMGYNLGELMEKYKEIFDEEWLDILSEKFHDFILELRREFKSRIRETKLQGIAVGDTAESDLFDVSYTNIKSEKTLSIDNALYYYVIFNVKSYTWEVVLGGKNKSLRERTRDYLMTVEKRCFDLRMDVSGNDRIASSIIVSKPDYHDLDKLKKRIVEKSLEFVNEMDIIMLDGKEKIKKSGGNYNQ